jgi:hypothetical protein
MGSQAPPRPVGGLSVAPHRRQAGIKQCHSAVLLPGRRYRAAPPRPALAPEPTATPVRKLLHSLPADAGVLLLQPAADSVPWLTCTGKKKTGVGLGTAIRERGRAARSCSPEATGSADAAVVDGGEERAHRGREVRGGVARAKAVGGARDLAPARPCMARR